MPRNFMLLPLVALSVVASGSARASEVDNYQTEGFVPHEVVDDYNGYFNDAIRRAVREWQKPEGNPSDEERAYRFVRAVYGKIQGSPVLTLCSDWYHRAGLPTYYNPDHVYRAVGGWTEFALLFKRPTNVIFMNGTPIGMDKVEHFLDGGAAVYLKYRKGGRMDERAGLDWAIATERTYLGIGVVGVYSNADLVADYEGYRFWRSLSEDGIVSGKAAVVTWKEGMPFIQREIDLRDHVNSYWNEAMNPSWFHKRVQRRFRAKIAEYCPLYRAHPEYYTPVNDKSLNDRYAHIGFRDNSGNRMENVCAGRP